MTRRLAQKNLRTALVIGAISMLMFAVTFLVAAIFVS